MSPGNDIIPADTLAILLSANADCLRDLEQKIQRWAVEMGLPDDDELLQAELQLINQRICELEVGSHFHGGEK